MKDVALLALPADLLLEEKVREEDKVFSMNACLEAMFKQHGNMDMNMDDPEQVQFQSLGF